MVQPAKLKPSRLYFAIGVALLGVVVFYLQPLFSPVVFILLLATLIAITTSILFGIRMEKRISEIQELYWQTRNKLAATTGEQHILQATDKASLAIASSEEQSLESVLSAIANETKQLLGGDRVGIGLMQNEEFIPSVVLSDTKTTSLASEQNKLLFDIISRILQAKRISPIIVDLSKASQLVDKKTTFYTFDKILIAPILSQNTLLGGIFVTNNKEKPQFTMYDIKKIGIFAAHAGNAISNARKHEELQMLIRMRDQFASVASHELKTPLSAIKLYTQLLQNKLSDSSDIQVEKSLSTINQEANKLTTLINTLLDFSRLQTGKFILDKKRFNLIEICKHNIAVMQALHPDHIFEFKTTIRSAVVLADRVRIEQVITNLLTNAARYSNPNTPISLHLKKEEGRYIISVEDKGIGMEPYEQEHIFEPFFQTEQSVRSKKSIHGMGLGLYISHQIVQKHRGKLWVKSQRDMGSTFYLSLPAKS